MNHFRNVSTAKSGTDTYDVPQYFIVYYQIPAKLQTSVGLEPLKAEAKSLNIVGFITYFHSQLGAMQI